MTRAFRTILAFVPLVALGALAAGNYVSQRSLTYTQALVAGAGSAPSGNPNNVGDKQPNGNGLVTAEYISCSVPDGGPTGCVPGAIRLRNAAGTTVTVCAAASQTINDAGTMQAYGWDNSSGAIAAWSRYAGADSTAATVGSRCWSFTPTLPASVPDLWMTWVANALGTSGTASVTVTINANVTN